MTSIRNDLGYALRQLRKSVGFTVTAVLLLALGVGAVTAIFSVFDQVMLRALPVSHPEQLVGLRAGGLWEGTSRTQGGDNDAYFSYPMYSDLRKQMQVFSGLACSSRAHVGVKGRGEPELAYAELVSGDFFQVLGLKPALGRLFVPADTRMRDAAALTVLEFGYWQSHFASDPKVLGQSLQVNGRGFTVIGVAPPGFHGAVPGDSPELFFPITMESTILPGRDDLDRHDTRWLTVMGRLQPGMAAKRAEAMLAPVWHALRVEEFKHSSNHSERFRKSFTEQSPLRLVGEANGFSPRRSELEAPLTFLMGLAGLVLVMACANIASLLLVRAAGRVREMAVRYALGAGKVRILQQLLMEGGLLGVAGGALGVAAAPLLTAGLLRMLFPSDGGGGDFNRAPDARVLVFSAVAAVTVTLLFSLTPMLEFWRPDVTGALKQQTPTTGGHSARLRRMLVTLQIALSVVLLVAAGLFVRTLGNLRSAGLGFATAHVLTVAVDPELSGYSPERTQTLYRQLLETLGSLPGVQAAGATNGPLLKGDSQGGNISIAGYKSGPDEDMDVEEDAVSPGYFPALGIPLLAGRVLAPEDTATGQKVALVNETFAKHFFGSTTAALGRQLMYGFGGHPPDTMIVGVVADTKHANIQDETLRTVFRPYTQVKKPGRMQFYLRTWQEPGAAVASVRGAVARLDPALALDHVETMDAQRADSISYERMMAVLAALFGLAAAAISAIGLYGVTAFTVGQRTREFGLRLAVGASRGQIVRLVLREVLRLAVAGIVVALPLALLVGRSMHGTLYGVKPIDPVTLVAVPLVMACVAIVAAGWPAHRAAGVDPMQALRDE